MIKESIMIAGAIVSVCIGSGFATGQELLQFFTAYGYKGLFTGLICMITMCYCCYTLLTLGNSGKVKDSNDIFIYLFGNYIGHVFKIIIPLFCLCSFVVMISGAGATLTQYYGIDKNIGQVLLAILSLISVMMGMDKVLEILGKIGPIIIIVVITVSIITIFKNFGNLDEVPQVLSEIDINKAVDNWWLSGIVYSGLNIIFVTQFLVGAGSSLKYKESCKLGGIIGGVAFIGAAMFINIAFLSDIESVYKLDIPTLYLAKNVSLIVANIFTIILVAEIYTTAAPLLWNVCSSLAKEKTLKFNVIALICTILGIVGGSLPFATLVNIMYPISGI
ncbi:YkvI family membrane protein, partial [Paraclostridium dentum]|uniref:YkvI family membrane protein n=1 Tax=Paraclostridium dentum TaxID=2662455 RepID=UPI003F417751